MYRIIDLLKDILRVHIHSDKELQYISENYAITLCIDALTHKSCIKFEGSKYSPVARIFSQTPASFCGKYRG